MSHKPWAVGDGKQIHPCNYLDIKIIILRLVLWNREHTYD